MRLIFQIILYHGEEKKIIRTIFETPGFLNKLKLGDPFQLISILGYANNDNIDKVEESETKSSPVTT